jgi:hypothetical protein
LIDLDSINNKFETKDAESEDKLILNLSKMINSEYDTIKELTDFEEGLRFALHRLLELKTLQFEYLNNPYYTLSELND